MPADQIHLDLPRSPGKKPVVDEAEVDRLIMWLSGRGWVTRRAIERSTDWDDRQVRALAEASGGHILGSQRGYRLTCQATPAERDECIGRLRGQRDKMWRRITQISNVHRRGTKPRCLR